MKYFGEVWYARAVFQRQVSVFPLPGLDATDNFFAREREISEAMPGRLYLGICASGRRLKAALIRVYVALLASSQTVYDRVGVRADPWMTLVGYFNSLRELGGMRRLAYVLVCPVSLYHRPPATQSLPPALLGPVKK